MVQVNEQGFVQLLNSLKCGTIVNLVTNTDVRMKKTGNPFANDHVVKHSVKRVQFGSSYAGSINARLIKQGSAPVFESSSLKWGKWYNGMVNKVIEHKDKLYARFYLINNNVSDDIYFINGKLANAHDTAVIKSFEYTSNPVPQSQVNAGLTSNNVYPFQPSFDSIESITVNGDVYCLK